MKKRHYSQNYRLLLVIANSFKNETIRPSFLNGFLFILNTSTADIISSLIHGTLDEYLREGYKYSHESLSYLWVTIIIGNSSSGFDLNLPHNEICSFDRILRQCWTTRVDNIQVEQKQERTTSRVHLVAKQQNRPEPAVFAIEVVKYHAQGK